MKLLLPVSVFVIAIAVLFTSSCPDQTPAELSVACIRGGQLQGCRALVWNDKGVQIRDEATDLQGVGYIQGLLPGKYKLTFVDVHDNKYAAERWITLQPGDSQNMQVDLDVASDPQYADTSAGTTTK